LDIVKNSTARRARRHLHDRRRLPAVEHDVGVREVVDDVDAVLTRKRDDLLEERQLDALRRRVRREVDDQHLRLREAGVDRLLQLREEVDVGGDRHVADVGARDHRPVDVDRVARVRHQHRVAAPSVASARCAMPSFEPMVTIASVSGSNSTP
jgi:hypothetical protein